MVLKQGQCLTHTKFTFLCYLRFVLYTEELLYLPVVSHAKTGFMKCT